MSKKAPHQERTKTIRIRRLFDALDHFVSHTHSDSTRLQQVEASLTLLHRKVDTLMATIKQVSDKLDEATAALTRIASEEVKQTTEIKRLRDLLAQGGAITEADLEPLLTRSTAIVDALSAIDDVDIPNDPTNG